MGLQKILEKHNKFFVTLSLIKGKFSPLFENSKLASEVIGDILKVISV